MPKLISDTAVYEACLDVLVERGYAGATTRLIAQAAGINEGTLFRKYGNKPKLITAAVNECAFRIDPDTIRHTGDARADLIRAVEGYQRGVEERGRLFPVIMSELARNPELRETVAAPHRVITALAGLMARYIDEGVIQTGEAPLQAVASLLGPLIVIGMLQQVSVELVPGNLDLADHVDRFLGGRS